MVTSKELRTILQAHKPKKIEPSEYPDFTPAAVLVPLFPSNQEFFTLLTKRTDLVDTHKGQIAFPGGMVDTKDKNLIATALREAKEEIGIEPNEVEILGTLDDHPVPSQFIITPCVGYIRAKPHVTLHSLEVAEVFEVPLNFFTDEKNGWVEEREFRGTRREVWFYSYEGRIIWGATAAIIRNLLSLITPSN